MRTNPIIGLPRSVLRLPRMAPNMSLLPTPRIVTLADDVTTRLYDTGEEHLEPVILLHGMVATGMLNWYQTFERLFSLWHVAHVPFVWIMVCCAIFHIVAVHAY